MHDLAGQSVLCAAVRAHRLVEFEYDGLPRIVAPYCHGFGANGAELVRGVQVDGESRSGGFGFGKLWSVSKMVDVRATRVTFLANDPGYNADDTALRRVHCRV